MTRMRPRCVRRRLLKTTSSSQRLLQESGGAWIAPPAAAAARLITKAWMLADPSKDLKTEDDAGTYAIIFLPPAVHQSGNVVGLENTVGEMFLEVDVQADAGAQGKMSPTDQA